MPHDFRNGSSAAGPSRTSGTFAPNVNSAADAALLAHAKRFNPVKMTAETRASYAAFCGITDNKVAAHLHMHYFTADYVNDY